MLKKALILSILYPLGTLLLYNSVTISIIQWSHHKHFWYFVVAFFCSLFVFYKWLESSSFYSTLRHELCHWLISVLSFQKPKGIHVHADGSGQYNYQGSGNLLIILAPYFLPLVTLFLLVISLVFSNPSPFFFVLIGIAFSFDCVSMAKDYHVHQTDWKSYGIVFSIQFSLLMLTIVSILSLTSLFMGYGAIPKLFKSVFYTLKSFTS